MVGFRQTLQAAGLVLAALGFLGAAQAASTSNSVAQPTLDWAGQTPSADARTVAQWALAGDANGKPFAVVDKKQARIFVFSAQGALVGASPALLGLTKGDDSAAGIALRAAAGTIGREERTTPAGRFESQPGHNNKGEAIVWVDYSAAIAIHRLRPAPAAERRAERLASETSEDNRISLGCVVVSGNFYDQIVATTLGRQRGVVYVLPDSRSLEATFPGIGTAL